MLIYRLIMALALPLVLLWGPKGALRERFGRVPAPAPGLRLWLHGASNGELTSARWLVKALIAARPGLQVLITCNTATARVLVQGWQMPGVTVAYAPVDTACATQRLLARWQPQALISLEAELWPARLAACYRADVPVILLAARMSVRSHRRWSRAPWLIRGALSRITGAFAQDAASRGYLADLGVQSFGPDIDLKAAASAALPAPVQAPRAARAHRLLAASTHDGEDALILDAFAAQGNFTQLILAPRHPSRAPAIAALITARGLTYAQRSSGAEPGATAVFLADTMGEMDRWYASCGACLIGGSFADHGGHTPWEPARQGSAILHGPFTANFAGPFATLDTAHAALLVSAQTLGPALQTLDAASQDRLAASATAIFRTTTDKDAVLSQLVDLSRL